LRAASDHRSSFRARGPGGGGRSGAGGRVNWISRDTPWQGTFLWVWGEHDATGRIFLREPRPEQDGPLVAQRPVSGRRVSGVKRSGRLPNEGSCWTGGHQHGPKAGRPPSPLGAGCLQRDLQGVLPKVVAPASNSGSEPGGSTPAADWRGGGSLGPGVAVPGGEVALQVVVGDTGKTTGSRGPWPPAGGACAQNLFQGRAHELGTPPAGKTQGPWPAPGVGSGGGPRRQAGPSRPKH